MLAYQIGAIALLSAALVASSVIGAPSQQPSSNGQQASGKYQTSSTLQSRAASAPSSQTLTTTTSSPPTQTTTAANLLASASTTVSSRDTQGTRATIAKPSLASDKSDSSDANAAPSANYEPMDSFDGRDPFGDDSLWQIPAHLARDVSSLQDDRTDEMAKEASSSPAATDDQDEDLGEALQPSTGRASTVPVGRQSSYLDAKPAMQYPQTIKSSETGASDLKTAAGYHYPAHGYDDDDYHDHHHHQQPSHHAGHIDAHYGKYFQYASVPKPGAWEFGYRRGNPKHTIEHYERGKGSHFQAKVKWTGKHGYGVHVYDYNHGDHHDGHHYEDDHYHGQHAPKSYHKKHYGHH